MGGWQNTITQQTKLTPQVVKETLVVVQQFVDELNTFLHSKSIAPVRIGHTLGSTAYYEVDDPDTEYGDVDLQMIAPDHEYKTSYQVAKYYNELIDEFLTEVKPGYVDETTPTGGHLIFRIGKGYDFVQVDMLWTTERLHHWDRWRKTPMRGVKGLVLGNLFSTLGEVINMSLQSAVLMKIKDGVPINYQRGRNPDEVVEVTHDIEFFGIDILEYVYEAVNGTKKGCQLDDELVQHPGLNIGDVQISDIVHTVRGLAKSFELNGLYGKHVLKDYNNSNELISEYLEHYLDKADRAGRGAKLNKARTLSEIEKVQELRKKITIGTAIVLLEFRS